MAKSFKYCADCDCVHAMGECGSEPQDRRKDHKRREKVRSAEQFLDFTDPLSLDPWSSLKDLLMTVFRGCNL